jgi:soluble P-type ATPase
MLEIEVPGRTTYCLHHLVLDVTGTVAVDGRLIEEGA